MVPVAAALIASQTAIASAASTPSSAPGFESLTAAQAAQLSQNATKTVIVIFKDQPAQAAAGTASARLRADAVADSQQSVVSELTEVHAKALKRFQLVNSLTATVSAGEQARLQTNPLVAEVIPDQDRLAERPRDRRGPARADRERHVE